MYDPNLGRWTTEDPIWPEDNINPYVYVDNRPTYATDPTGLALFAENEYSAMRHLLWFRELGATTVEVEQVDSRYIFSYADRRQIEEIISRSKDQSVKDLLGALISDLGTLQPENESHLTIFLAPSTNKRGKLSGVEQTAAESHALYHYYSQTKVSQSEETWLHGVASDATDDYRRRTGGVLPSPRPDPGQYAVVTPITRYQPQPPPEIPPEVEAEIRDVHIMRVLLDREDREEWKFMTDEKRRERIEEIKRDIAAAQWTEEAELEAIKKKIWDAFYDSLDVFNKVLQTISIAVYPPSAVLFATLHVAAGKPEAARDALVEGIVSKGAQVATDKVIRVGGKIIGKVTGRGAKAEAEIAAELAKAGETYRIQVQGGKSYIEVLDSQGRVIEKIPLISGGSGLPLVVLSREEELALMYARNMCRGDCERAAIELRRLLPGGNRLRFSTDRLLHEAYEFQGKVFDITARQYVRPGVWTQEALEKAGLTSAIETGVFTPAQHNTFMSLVKDTLGAID